MGEERSIEILISNGVQHQTVKAISRNHCLRVNWMWHVRFATKSLVLDVCNLLMKEHLAMLFSKKNMLNGPKTRSKLVHARTARCALRKLEGALIWLAKYANTNGAGSVMKTSLFIYSLVPTSINTLKFWNSKVRSMTSICQFGSFGVDDQGSFTGYWVLWSSWL